VERSDKQDSRRVYQLCIGADFGFWSFATGPILATMSAIPKVRVHTWRSWRARSLIRLNSRHGLSMGFAFEQAYTKAVEFCELYASHEAADEED
jgi:hypothetical protein